MPATLPLYDLKTKVENDETFVWDPLRMRYFLLTPEEHVRQCLIQWLIGEKGVPRGLMSVERGIRYHDRRKRYDLVVHDRAGQPLICCECKAPYVPVDGETAFQAATYNATLGADYLLLTNGKVLRTFIRTEKRFREVGELPEFEAMAGGR